MNSKKDMKKENTKKLLVLKAVKVKQDISVARQSKSSYTCSNG